MPLSFEVCRAFHNGILRQIALSADQLLTLCPESSGQGWVVDKIFLPVYEARGMVYRWDSGRKHVHWLCPLCGRQHISDLNSNDISPMLWFCEIGGDNDLCLVHWEHVPILPTDVNMTGDE
jgi:hypothetical protein